MKKNLILLVCVFFFGTLVSAQENKEIKKEEKKIIIIKKTDDDGKLTTKIIEGDDLKDGAIWIDELGDSIKIDVDIDKFDGSKKITKTIVIQDGDEEEEVLFFSDDMPDCKHPKQNKKCLKHDFRPGMGIIPPFENKAKLGVYIEDFSGGVKVTEVIENSAAYSVGIFPGDVITEIDDKKMTNTEELIREVGNHQPGDMIEIELKRNGKNKEFNVRLHGQDLKKMQFEKQFKKMRFQDADK